MLWYADQLLEFIDQIKTAEKVTKTQVFVTFSAVFVKL